MHPQAELHRRPLGEKSELRADGIADVQTQEELIAETVSTEKSQRSQPGFPLMAEVAVNPKGYVRKQEEKVKVADEALNLPLPATRCRSLDAADGRALKAAE